MIHANCIASPGSREKLVVLEYPRDLFENYPPILNILVPQTAQVPESAFFPFFMVTCFESFISLFVLHFIQYP